MPDFIVTVKVRFAVTAECASSAFEIANEKAIELLEPAAMCGAFETEADEDTPLDHRAP